MIFTSLRTDGDDGYAVMSRRMDELAAQQPGFLGIESAREDVGITVSYWADEAAARAWKQVAEHLVGSGARKVGLVQRLPGARRDRRPVLRPGRPALSVPAREPSRMVSGLYGGGVIFVVLGVAALLLYVGAAAWMSVIARRDPAARLAAPVRRPSSPFP